MKKKQLNIFLFFLLILIWGSIMKKLFVKKNTSDINYNLNNFNVNGNKTIKPKSDFRLNITNNPFKKSIVIKNKRAIKVNNHSPSKFEKKSNKNNPKINFPDVKYYGFVKRKKSKNPLLLIRIGEKLYRIKPNEKVKGISIININTDSIKVLFNDKIKIVKKIDI